MSKLRRLIEAANEPCTMSWKVYSYNPLEDNKLMNTSKAFDDIAMAQQYKREILKKNPNYIVEIVAESAQKNEAGELNYFTYTKDKLKTIKDFENAEKEMQKALKEEPNGFAKKDIEKDIITVRRWKSAKFESSQKNEAKTIDDIRTADIAKYLKDNKKTDLKALKLKSKAFAKDLQNYFKLTFEPSIFDIDKVLNALPYFMQEATNIDVKNPGVLEVPEGKKVDELPQSHFEKLVDKKGYAEVIRALTNLEVWNKDKNKKLSSWASNMADKLKKKFRPESFCKTESLDLSKLSNDDATKLAKHFNDFAKDKTMRYDLIDKIEDILKKKYKAESTQKNEDMIPATLDSIIINYKDTHDKAKFTKIVDELSKLLKTHKFVTYRDLYKELQGWRYQEKDIKEIFDAVEKKSGIKNNMSESTQKNESKVNMSKLKNEIQAAVNKYFKDDKDLLEYVYVDTKKDGYGRDILEVRAELGYNGMVNLADYLDKIVRKYDKWAYFDQETSGIMTAVFESAQKNEATFKPGDKVSVKSYYKDGNQFITLRNATIIKEITEKEAGQLDPAYNWKEPTGMKYYLVKLDTGSKKAVLASDLTLESAQKNENLAKQPKLKEIWLKWKFNTKYGLHYTDTAKDINAFNAKISKPNTFWLEDEDTGEAIIQGSPKDLINFMMKNKTEIKESTQKNEDKLIQCVVKLKEVKLQSSSTILYKPIAIVKDNTNYDTKIDIGKLYKQTNDIKYALAYHKPGDLKLKNLTNAWGGKYDWDYPNESAQKNETSLRDLNLDLADDTNALITSADKIRQRFEYRTLQNMSYDEKQAEKIYLEIRRELEKAKKLIDACYNKIG